MYTLENNTLYLFKTCNCWMDPLKMVAHCSRASTFSRYCQMTISAIGSTFPYVNSVRPL